MLVMRYDVQGEEKNFISAAQNHCRGQDTMNSRPEEGIMEVISADSWARDRLKRS